MTASQPKEVLAVGWDVGGWLGKKQGLAILRATPTTRAWCGTPRTFRINQLPKDGGSPVDLIRLGWSDAPDDVLTRFRVVIGIDAPLGFPAAFSRLVAGEDGPAECPETEIESTLAYRETDRAVYEAFDKKKPLSASFDKLGNNATVALAHVRRWRKHDNLRVLPFAADDGVSPTAIEVYPALVKREPGELSATRLGRLLPSGLVAGDEQDAAICAVLAAGLLLGGTDLPPLVGPTSKLEAAAREEGWIYYPDRAWLRGGSARQEKP